MDQIIEELRRLRQYKDHPARFWQTFLEYTTQLARATTGVLMVQIQKGEAWRQLGAWPAADAEPNESAAKVSLAEEVAANGEVKRYAWARLGSRNGDAPDEYLFALRLEVYDDLRTHVALYVIGQSDAASIEQTAGLLALVADIPRDYGRWRTTRHDLNDAGKLSDTLDLLSRLNVEKRYPAAAMIFVNEIASRYRCLRASLGWHEAGYIRLQAISHTEKFDKHMEIVQALESVMEESFDQDEDILLPSGQSTAVLRDHEAFSRRLGSPSMASLPLRLAGRPLGVLTCERADMPISEAEVKDLRVLCDQAVPRLDELKKNDRSFVMRLADTVRAGAARVVGVQHTMAKVAGITAFLLVVFLLIGSITYRVEAPFVLRSDQVKYLPAPFDGYIDKVHVKVGDEVREGVVLLTLSTRDLLLEEAATLSTQIRFSRDAEKARAEKKLADMNIAMAQADQASAQLALVRHQIHRAEIKAPFSGVVVEGELADLQGASVTKGKVLFKVAGLEKMYAELEVSERDIHELAEGMTGEIAFVSRPNVTFPTSIERIDPVAVAKKDYGNVFLVRCSISESTAPWWRPGMSGVAKVTVGKRNALWIVTHRTVDFLRMRLWW